MSLPGAAGGHHRRGHPRGGRRRRRHRLLVPPGDSEALAAKLALGPRATRTSAAPLGAAAGSASSTAGRWMHTAVKTVEQYRIRLGLANRHGQVAVLTVRFDQLGVRAGRPPARHGLRGGPPRSSRYRRGARVVAFDFSAAELQGRRRPVRRHDGGRRGRHRPPARWPARPTATPSTCRSRTTPSTASSPPRSSSTSPTTSGRSTSCAGCCKPGGTARRHRAVVAPRAGLLVPVRRVPRPFVEGGHVRIFTARPSCEGQMRRRRPRAPRRATTPTPCTRPTGGSKCAVGPTNDDHPLVKAYLQAPRCGTSSAPSRRAPSRAGRAGPQPRPRQDAWSSTPASRRETGSPDAASTSPASSSRRRASTRRVDGIAEWQLPNGHDPVVPGGHADPWNHVEAAMALDLGGHARRRRRRPTTGSSTCSEPTARGTSTTWPTTAPSSRTSSTPTSCAYVAAGVWHHWLLHQRPRVRRGHVAGRGARHRLRARAAARRAARSSGPATPTAPRGASPCSPARRRSATACAAPSRSPSCSATSAPTGSSAAARLAHGHRAP